ncbi:hypothetical protein [Poseidonocella sedimentorum]|uniref:MgtC family protein n=1 Tax=Poseidonocella sedimentorum TaxID=871652 RepID=A0A1I6DW77_9RHOB|nr:hypothetical protein [Poseidonocella sedimentorum]SFR09591.1 hypothetical protein SAMN04515673_105265 [Poseidonocella sedimentorum]
MFGLIRLVIFALFAFAAGVLFERQQASEKCLATGGTMTAGLCLGAGS